MTLTSVAVTQVTQPLSGGFFLFCHCCYHLIFSCMSLHLFHFSTQKWIVHLTKVAFSVDYRKMKSFLKLESFVLKAIYASEGATMLSSLGNHWNA